MKSVQVNLGSRSYPIHVKSGLLKQTASILSDQNHGQKWVIISQYNLMDLFGFDLMTVLNESGFNCDFIPLGKLQKVLMNLAELLAKWLSLVAIEKPRLSP